MAPPTGEYYVDGQHIDPQYENLAERILAFNRAANPSPAPPVSSP